MAGPADSYGKLAEIVNRGKGHVYQCVQDLGRAGLVTVPGPDSAQPIAITDSGLRELLVEVMERVPEKGVTGMTPRRTENLERWLTLANKLKGYNAGSYSDLLAKGWSELENHRSETVKLLGGRSYYDLQKTMAKIAVTQLRKKGPDLSAELS